MVYKTGLRGPKPKDITNKKFGRLTAVRIVGKDNNRTSIWECKCDCGNLHSVRSSQLRNGTVKSCGCIVGEINPVAKERLFSIWQGMKSRCYKDIDPQYKHYGKRGIRIYSDWFNDYKEFREWALNNGYKDDLTIERINNDKGYYPENCKWITMKEQQSNKRNNVYVEYKGDKVTLTKLSEISGIKLTTLHHRYKNGDRGERLLRVVRSYKLQLKDIKEVAGGGV